MQCNQLPCARVSVCLFIHSKTLSSAALVGYSTATGTEQNTNCVPEAGRWQRGTSLIPFSQEPERFIKGHSPWKDNRNDTFYHQSTPRIPWRSHKAREMTEKPSPQYLITFSLSQLRLYWVHGIQITLREWKGRYIGRSISLLAPFPHGPAM